MTERGSILAGKYQVLGELSRGGQGRILLVQDLHLPKKWAVKEVQRRIPGEIPKEAQIKMGRETAAECGAVCREEDCDRMRREAVLLGSRNHPGLPTVVDFMEEEENCYLVMEYIEGQTLREAVMQNGSFSEKECIALMRQAAEILAYLHSLRPPVWHLDIKPANLLLTRERKLMLVDFGAAMEAQEAVYRRGACYGTYGYAPPEQCGKGTEGGVCDGRSDIYALGVTIYFCLTGKEPGQPPFGIMPDAEWENAAGADFIRIIKRCTHKEPEKRFQTMQELTEALERCHFGSGKLKRCLREFLPGKRTFILAREKSIFYTAKEEAGLIDSVSEE